MTKICVVDGCEKLTCAKDLCATHYSRMRNHSKADVCGIDGCVRVAHGHSVCGTHARRLRRSGTYELWNGTNETSCPQGHAFTPENSGVASQKRRFCLACAGAREQEALQALQARQQAQEVAAAAPPIPARCRHWHRMTRATAIPVGNVYACLLCRWMELEDTPPSIAQLNRRYRGPGKVKVA